VGARRFASHAYRLRRTHRRIHPSRPIRLRSAGFQSKRARIRPALPGDARLFGLRAQHCRGLDDFQALPVTDAPQPPRKTLSETLDRWSDRVTQWRVWRHPVARLAIVILGALLFALAVTVPLELEQQLVFAAVCFALALILN